MVQALTLFQSGRSHALSSELLFRAALSEGKARDDVEDPEKFAFNGSYSLSVNYLLGLGIELMLKAALVQCGYPSDDRSLRALGHDLVRILDEAEEVGFHSEAPRLRDLVTVLNAPYKQHWLRYDRPEQFPLPGDFQQVAETLAELDDELRLMIDGYAD